MHEAGAAAREVTWQVEGLTLAGRVWGAAGGVPVLALHGWLDNAGSFAALAPRLAARGAEVAALDAAGHGLSDHRSADASYAIWEDLPLIEGVLDALGWPRAVLMGHSRGAMQATLFAAARPDRARALITLDGMMPLPQAAEGCPAQLGRHLAERARTGAMPDRVFPDLAAFVARRSRHGVTEAMAEVLAERALAPAPGGLRVQSDPRLMAASAVKLTAPQITAVLRAIACPVLAIWARDGLQSRPDWSEMIAPAAHVAALSEHWLPGGHHGHMEPTFAEAVAELAAGLLGAETMEERAK